MSLLGDLPFVAIWNLLSPVPTHPQPFMFMGFKLGFP